MPLGETPSAAGTQLNNFSGSTGLQANFEQYDISSCATSNCSVGFHFNSVDGTVPGTGAFILRFEIQEGLASNASYNVLEGTSMATPHVSGLAALLFAFQPHYTFADVIDAIQFGGIAASSLAGFTTTGNAVNAMGSLDYIPPSSKRRCH